ncbi:hypothetical protein WICPIJ_000703 [Wickerhamomyces pijperi]|uniref:Uncharacterized protein n=1 Tax=Wickerhamomyces pijperi TaxID=599730 RepID=A0A9P8QD92_WICPI|nr:hypothetical protein WICPIJ_000703 [Wickerhamomyces pijperi]
MSTAASVAMTRDTRSYSISTSEDEDLDLALGGYGYFDMDDLAVRSVQQSRSTTPIQSKVNSTTNLLNGFQLSQKNMLKEAGKKLKYDSIKDTFETAINKSSSSLNASSVSNASVDQQVKLASGKHPNYSVKFDRAAVGKKIEIGDQ